MNKRTIAIELRSLNYTDLYIFAQGVHDGVRDNPAFYPSPVPSLALFQASIDNMSIAITNYGERGNAGGTKERAALMLAREVLRENIRDYARYVMLAQPNNYEAWLALGFHLKKLPAKTNTLQMVQNFHRFIARNILPGQIKFKWSRPLGAPKATIITYLIFRSEGEIFSQAAHIGTTVNRATFTDAPPKTGVMYNYWVMPTTSAGNGVISEMITAIAYQI